MVIYCGKHFYRIVNFPGNFFKIRKEHLDKFPFSNALPKKYYWLAKKLFKIVESEKNDYIVISNDEAPEIIADTVAIQKQLVLYRYHHYTSRKIRYHLNETTKTFIKAGITNTKFPKKNEVKWTIRLVL